MDILMLGISTKMSEDEFQSEEINKDYLSKVASFLRLVTKQINCQEDRDKEMFMWVA